MSLAQQINFIVEQMPEEEQVLVLELVKRIVSPDDVLSDEDVADIEQARREYAKGVAVPMDAIDWD